MQLSGQWPAFVVESHHVRYEDDSVMLGEELLKKAEAPPQQEPIEGQAAVAGAAPEGQAEGAGVGGERAGAGAADVGQAEAAGVGGGQAGTGAEDVGQAAAAAEGGQVGAEGGEDHQDALDYDGVGPPERKSEKLIFQ